MGLYKYFRWLSLDIVLGAIFFLYYMEEFYQVSLSTHVYFALASAIWLIYTADHLIDGKKVNDPSNNRHIFHQRNFRVLILIGGSILVLALINVAFLPDEIVRSGAILSACCVSYLLLVFFFKKLWMKELLVAIVYSCGILLAPIALSGQFSMLDISILGQLILIAFLNLLVFSYFDFSNDQKDGFGSMVIRMGNKVSKAVIHALAILSILVSGMGMISLGQEIHLIFLLMSVMLYALIIFPSFFLINERFRTIGDGVFYLPLFFVL